MFIVVYDINGARYALTQGYDDEPLWVFPTYEAAESWLQMDKTHGHLGMIVELVPA